MLPGYGIPASRGKISTVISYLNNLGSMIFNSNNVAKLRKAYLDYLDGEIALSLQKFAFPLKK